MSKKADYIIAKSEYSRNFLKEINCDTNEIFIEPIVDEIFQWKKNLFDKNIFFVGSVTKHKGIFRFLKIANELFLNNILKKAYIIGPIDKSIKSELNTFYNNKDYVFTGKLTANDIIKYFYNGGIYCMFSYAENSPNSLIEAQAYGLPCICTNVGSIKSIIVHNKNGITLNNWNTNDAISQISSIFDDPNKYEKLSKNSKLMALERWNYKKNSDKYVSLYKKINNLN